MIDRLVEANDFDPETSEMLRNVLKLSDTLTREIMVPRTDMICIGKEQTLVSMLKLCSRSGFSRVPVIGEDVDDLIGVAYLKDAVRATAFKPGGRRTHRRFDRARPPAGAGVQAGGRPVPPDAAVAPACGDRGG